MPTITTPTRTETNRANAQHSTGPRTAEGKSHSSQNAFKHGLYSKRLILPGECSIAFDELRADLRSEHQPINTTEEMLVDDLAQHFWRMRRFREMEARAWVPSDISTWIETGLLALAARALASAERGFFRTLAALTKLQTARGFVPQKSLEPADEPASDTTPDDEDHLDAGFVPPNQCAIEDLPSAKRYAPFSNARLAEDLSAATIQTHDRASLAGASHPRRNRRAG